MTVPEAPGEKPAEASRGTSGSTSGGTSRSTSGGTSDRAVGGAGSGSSAEHRLAARVLGALLLEDYGG
ncbi:hypothetical protein HKK72_31740, partial [Actinomadura sp. HBU206391]|nr:hypothetical protein [Actinomadura sp. HBU206391]